jgi:hypothetical protein
MMAVKKDLTATVTLKQGDSDAMPSAGFYVTKSNGAQGNAFNPAESMDLPCMFVRLTAPVDLCFCC